ncbi:MAG: hypothetical protein ACREMJ_01545 [Gemmatimonadales bacterium]
MVLALAFAMTAVAGAQGMGLFREPVFVLQPGFIKSFSDGADFHFNARFTTAIPTSIPRTTIVAIVQWTPFNDPGGTGIEANQPAFVYGPVVNVVNQRSVSFDIDALFAYAPNGTGTGSPYSHQFLVEGDLFIKLGSMMGMKSQWNSLSLYAFVAYLISGQPDAAESKDKTLLLTGLSLPLAPWKK